MRAARLPPEVRTATLTAPITSGALPYALLSRSRTFRPATLVCTTIRTVRSERLGPPAVIPASQPPVHGCPAASAAAAAVADAASIPDTSSAAVTLRVRRVPNVILIHSTDKSLHALTQPW